jgi:hypothetical protein
MEASAGDDEELAKALGQWRQGDYSLAVTDFVLVDELVEDGGPQLDARAETVPGLVVVTQTCDIVNAVLGKDYVVVSPLRELTQQAIEDVQGFPVIAIASAVRGIIARHCGNDAGYGSRSAKSSRRRPREAYFKCMASKARSSRSHLSR